MSFVELFFISIALSIDAFSVSFGVGCKYHTPRHYFRVAWHFGLFQFMMPLIGALIGSKIQEFTDKLNYISAMILFFIAFKMLKETLKKNKEFCVEEDPTKGFSLIFLSIATSIDALGVGFTFVLYNGNIFAAALLIGFVCAIFSIVGVYLGSLSKNIFGKKIEIFGAVVLIIISIKFILV